MRRLIRRRKCRQEKPMSTYNKLLTSSLVVIASLWISWSYILATVSLVMYGNTDPLSTLSEEVCRTVIATVLGYCAKALFENISKYGFKTESSAETESAEDSFSEDEFAG